MGIVHKSTKQIIVPLRSFLKFFCYQKFDIFKEVNKSEIVIINGNIRYLSNLLIILTTLILNKKPHLVGAFAKCRW